MKTPEEITENVDWISELYNDDITEIHECMRQYAREAIDAFVEKWWNEVDVQDKEIEKFKKQL